ncbi:MAG TPA: adenosylcobinamide-GDP ribazoletransferase [Solirubrobacterales bacterium]|nr:adenosylcobinamide-GDP ribazoletransferase [Solirubrobacterales bacterium]
MSEGRSTDPLAGLSLAVSLLTVAPVPVRDRGGEAPGALASPKLGPAAPWFPLVGAVIGAFAGGIRVGAAPLVGTSVASVLALIALVAVTGALHQDGLADCSDGLGVRGDRERRLTVMRDSALGAFGVLALIGWALLFVTALAALDDGEAILALIAAAALARWAALLHAAAAPPARSNGLGASFSPSRNALAIATIAALALAFLTGGALPGLAAVGGALLATALLTLWSRHTLGGRTGDTLGGTVAVAEVVVLLALVACWTG